MLKNIRARAAGALSDQLFKVIPITIPVAIINDSICANLERINATTGNTFQSLKIQSCLDFLTIHGKVLHGSVFADFSIKVIPLEPVWEANSHQLLFKILDSSLEIEKSGIRGALAALGKVIFESITGMDIFSQKLRDFSDEQGNVVLVLDFLNGKASQTLKYLELKQIKPGNEKITLSVQVIKRDIAEIPSEIIQYFKRKYFQTCT
ncbi:MAG: hypothetical protein IH614_01080 [Desulfuromonadales bacterium]|nr:hypothetical protein [Desulfuromonadales bacterium]